MPMNDIDGLLSATADYFQAQLDAEPELAQQLEDLLNNDQKPNVYRELKGCGLNSFLMIQAMRRSY